jgi:hypothetical protein
VRHPIGLLLWLLLTVVAGAAAVLSFSSLTELAALCGYTHALAPLFPITVDAGTAAGCLAWLSTPSDISGQLPRRFARTLTLVLLTASVAGNALVHYLVATSEKPSWWLVVAVSAVAPAVLGTVVHLAVVSSQARTGRPEPLNEQPRYVETPESDPVTQLIESGAGRRRIALALGISEHQARLLLAARNGHGHV